MTFFGSMSTMMTGVVATLMTLALTGSALAVSLAVKWISSMRT